MAEVLFPSSHLPSSTTSANTNPHDPTSLKTGVFLGFPREFFAILPAAHLGMWRFLGSATETLH
jgi:hypothetical protein